jgi:hypothetical protein
MLSAGAIDNRSPGASRGETRVIFAIAAIALMVRLTPLLRAGDSWAVLDDSHEYLALVHGMSSGCGFARLINGACRAPELLRLPGYPLFVAAMPTLRAVVAAQAFIGAATCLIVGWFTFSRWGVVAGVVAETLLALDIPSIVASSTIMSDCLFEALLAAAMVLEFVVILRAGIGGRAAVLTLIASALLACAVLVRAVAIIVPVFAIVPFLFMTGVPLRRRLALSLLALALPAAVMAGWTARNRAVGGRWVFTTEGSYNLYYYNAAGVLGYRTGENLTQLQSRLSRDIEAEGPDEYFSAEQQSEMNRRGVEIFLHHPFDAAAMTLRCFAWLMIVPDRANLNALLGTHARSSVFLIASQDVALRVKEMLHSPLLTAVVTVQMPFIFIMWTGVALVLIRSRRMPPAQRVISLLALCVAAAMMLVGTGPGVIARFRLPAMPYLAMLAGIGWSAYLREHRLLDRREAVALEPPKHVRAASALADNQL